MLLEAKGHIQIIYKGLTEGRVISLIRIKKTAQMSQEVKNPDFEHSPIKHA